VVVSALKVYPRIVFFEQNAIVHEGVVPCTRIFCIKSLLNKRKNLPIADFFFFCKKEMQKYGADICFNTYRGHVKGERADCRGGCVSNSWQCSKESRIRWKHAAKLAHYDVRGFLQHERAPVIAKPLPVRKNVAERSRGKRVKIWKRANEWLVLCEDSAGLRLLEHEFRNQNSIGIAGVPPGKIALMLCVRAKNGVLKFFDFTRSHCFWLCCQFLPQGYRPHSAL